MGTLRVNRTCRSGQRLRHSCDACARAGCRPRLRPRPRRVLTSDHFERDVHVVACGMRIGTDLFMRLPDERGELGLREALVLDAHLHRETETTCAGRLSRRR